MKKLSNNELSNVDLKLWCDKNVPGFVEVIDRTEFPKIYKHMKPGQSLIVNLDPKYETGGTHWTALRISSDAPLVYYKDSFGAPCPSEIIDSVKKSGLGLVYGNKINQKISQQNCGKRAAEFLYNMAQAAMDGNEINYFDESEN